MIMVLTEWNSQESPVSQASQQSQPGLDLLFLLSVYKHRKKKSPFANISKLKWQMLLQTGQIITEAVKHTTAMQNSCWHAKSLGVYKHT